MTPEAAERIIRASLEYDSGFTFEDVLDKIASGHATVFETENAVEVVTIYEVPEGRGAYAWVGGCATGKFREMRDSIRPQVEAFATANGCKWIELKSRPAAARILAPYGYRVLEQDGNNTVTMRKAI